MTDFYADWRGNWERAERERTASRKAIHPDEFVWTKTADDARAALMVSRQTGFRTWGTSSYIAEIPVGWNSGEHRHGEECVHILAGTGMSLIDGVLYHWSAGSTIAIPYGASHQHINTGGVPVRYVSVQAPDLEHFAGIHRITHVKDCGPTGDLPEAPVQASGLHPDGYRIVLGLSEAVTASADNTAEHQDDCAAAGVRSLLEAADGKPVEMGDTAAMLRSLSLQHDQAIHLMKIGRPMNGFNVRHVEMSAINSDPPQAAGGKHAHMEAMLYILDGTGYTIIDGERWDWEPGCALYITGPQTVHQHFITGDRPSMMLRMASGFRYFLEAAAKAEFPYLLFEARTQLDG